ncbi:MAG: phosphate ABC transporter ATP-binding protein PstB [Miltoncostaeaceae bacterium]
MTTNVDPEKTAKDSPIEIHLAAGAADRGASQQASGAQPGATSSEPSLGPPIFRLQDMGVWYGKHHAVRGVTMDVPRNAITALIGPSGCGKSTLLRSVNRMNDLIPGAQVEGRVLFGDEDLLSSDVDPVDLRGRIGMVFQKPNPFPKSIKDNLEFGMKVNGIKPTAERVEQALVDAALWDEVKDRLKAEAFSLSGGQQQRLCIARAIAVEPEVILMDEPCSALDPIATLAIEDLMKNLAERYTLVVVTHNMQQAARISDQVAFMTVEGTAEGDRTGVLAEVGTARQIFSAPKDPRTEAYITGRVG